MRRDAEAFKLERRSRLTKLSLLSVNPHIPWSMWTECARNLLVTELGCAAALARGARRGRQNPAPVWSGWSGQATHAHHTRAPRVTRVPHTQTHTRVHHAPTTECGAAALLIQDRTGPWRGTSGFEHVVRQQTWKAGGSGQGSDSGLYKKEGERKARRKGRDQSRRRGGGNVLNAKQQREQVRAVTRVLRPRTPGGTGDQRGETK